MDKTAFILVIDDDPDIRELVEEYLSAQGFEVECAADANAARAAMQRRKPDLVVLDVMLPKLSGFDVCKKARAAGHVEHRTAGFDQPREAPHPGRRLGVQVRR